MARGKSWRRAEDLSLVLAIAAALRDAPNGAAAFWQRVAAQFERELAEDAHAPPRTWTAIEGRWKSLRAELAAFVACFEAAGRDEGGAARSEGERVDAALVLFRENDPKRRPFEHLDVWKLVRREIPRHEDFVAMSTSSYMAQRRRRHGGGLEQLENGDAASGSGKRRRRMPSVNGMGEEEEEEEEEEAREENGDDADTVDGDEGGGSDGSEEAAEPPPADDGEQCESSDHTQQQLQHSAAEVAKYRRAKLEAYETRNALLAEQNAIATERNMIALFANRDDAMSNEFFDLKRRLEIAKLRQEVAEVSASH